MNTTATARSLKDTGCTFPGGQHKLINGRCTRCGFSAPVAPVAPAIDAADNEKFESVWEAEMLVRSEAAGVIFTGTGTPQYRRENADRGLARAKAALFAMVEAFTPQEAKAYGEYRSGVLAEIAAMKA